MNTITPNIVTLTRWDDDEPPTEAALTQRFEAEGLSPYRWANWPHDEYTAHTHTFHKVLYVLEGSITFGLPDHDEQYAMNAGDRLDLPPGVRHDAHVGPDGVTCLEAHHHS